MNLHTWIYGYWHTRSQACVNRILPDRYSSYVLTTCYPLVCLGLVGRNRVRQIYIWIGKVCNATKLGINKLKTRVSSCALGHNIVDANSHGLSGSTVRHFQSHLISNSLPSQVGSASRTIAGGPGCFATSGLREAKCDSVSSLHNPTPTQDRFSISGLGGR